MKAFKYVWKSAGAEFIGECVCEDQTTLKNKIHSLGGELVRILEENEKIETAPIIKPPQIPQNSTMQGVSVESTDAIL